MGAECVAQPLIKVTLSYFNVITTLMQTAVVDLTVDRKLPGSLINVSSLSVYLRHCDMPSMTLIKMFDRTCVYSAVGSMRDHAKYNY